jgi:serine/threonine protein kinase
MSLYPSPCIPLPLAAQGVSLFAVENQVGGGTFGDVFKATYRDDGCMVAMKKIKMEKETQGFPITAIREIKILNVLKHQNIVELKEITSFTGGKRVFIN